MSSQKAKLTNCSIINIFDLYKSQYHQTPGRFVSFISTCFGGSTSDQQICERSALSTLCDSGHSVMVDKGFNVHDLFAPSNVTINIPTFFHKKNRMTGKTVLKDRRIYSKRVHIKRVIVLAKHTKYLKNQWIFLRLNLQVKLPLFVLCFVILRSPDHA